LRLTEKSQGWESPYRDVETVPVLLVQLQDDLSRSRMREAFWISLIVHLLIVIALWNSPILSSILGRLFPRRAIACTSTPSILAPGCAACARASTVR